MTATCSKTSATLFRHQQVNAMPQSLGRRTSRSARSPFRLAGLAIAVGGFFLANAPAQALTINATFGSAMTSSQQNMVNSAIGFYENSFTDNVSVNIYFNSTTSTSFAGQSQSAGAITSYASYAGALQNDASAYGNAVEQTAYNNLGSGNTAQDIYATSADMQALGLSSGGGINSTGTGPGSYDGDVTISDSYFYTATIQHEIDEVLGIGGAGSVLNIMQQSGLTSPPTYHGKTYIGAMDLFRYSAPGTPSLTTSGTATSYFSIDGGMTDIVGFNQNSNGDYGDWVAGSGSSCYVQNWRLCTAASISLTSPEGTALQAIGYDAVAPVPLPGSAILFVSGLIGFGAACRRRTRSAGA